MVSPHPMLILQSKEGMNLCVLACAQKWALLSLGDSTVKKKEVSVVVVPQQKRFAVYLILDWSQAEALRIKCRMQGKAVELYMSQESC